MAQAQHRVEEAEEKLREAKAVLAICSIQSQSFLESPVTSGCQMSG